MLDEPPAKRMKLQKRQYSHPNKENHNPDYIWTDRKLNVRKRKVPTRKPTVPNILDLNSYVLLEVFDYLSLQDLCNLAETNIRMRQLARRSFQFRTNSLDLQVHPIDLEFFSRLLNNFGNLMTSITISTR